MAGGLNIRRRNRNSAEHDKVSTPDHTSVDDTYTEITTTSTVYVAWWPKTSIGAIAFACLIYANGIAFCDFCFDDLSAIVDNPDVLDARGDRIMSPWYGYNVSCAFVAAVCSSAIAVYHWFIKSNKKTPLICQNDIMYAFAHRSALWRNDFWGRDITHRLSHKSYRPLTILSFRVDVLWEST